MDAGITCLVTIHGIGFEQPPTADTPGYADGLHDSLKQALDSQLLGDDPKPPDTGNGNPGPIYVQSSWPPSPQDLAAGPQRLGTWEQSRVRAVDGSGAPLVQGDTRVAHIALVYTHLQDQGPLPGSAIDTLARSALSLGHYTTILGLASTLFADIKGVTEDRSQPAEPSGLRRRTDVPLPTHHALSRVLPRGATQPTGLFSTLRTLEDDVAAYVCRNDLRERVRAFVRDALHRLCYRDDVSSVIVNAHSNGTVIAYDVMRELTPIAAQKVRWFVTAGSPLRKYTDLFFWGTEVGSIASMGNPKGWSNFWDEKDPVADPLAPPLAWLRGTALPPPLPDESLFKQVDNTAALAPVNVADFQVDNVHNSSGGGLQAHNYWSNRREVIVPLATIVRDVVALAG